MIQAPAWIVKERVKKGAHWNQKLLLFFMSPKKNVKIKKIVLHSHQSLTILIMVSVGEKSNTLFDSLDFLIF